MAKTRRLKRYSSLWDAKTEPSLEGSGVLPPNPRFDRPRRMKPTPKLDEIIEAFSTPVDLTKFPSMP
jgi:hypothetical protein